MKKAMIVTIGTGYGVENGIYFSVKQQNPDYICFIYSSDSKKTMDSVLEKLGYDEGNEKISLKNVNEINDVEILYQEYSKYIDEIVAKGYDFNQLVADYTSGTKSMSAALVSAAISKNIGVLSYVYGQRDAQGRVISDTERLSSLSPKAIFTEQKIKLFKSFFNNNQFEAAVSLFKNEPAHYNYKEDVEFLLQIGQAYGEWDRFNFKKASEIMVAVNLDSAKKLGLKSLIESHKTILYKLKTASESKKSTESDIVDLFFNAKRRQEEGKYDDCVSRLYRLIEMVGQVEFEREYKTGTDKVEIEFLPVSLKDKFSNNGLKTVSLGLMDVYTVLLEKSNNLKAKSFFENHEKLKKILSVRNHSRLAHGQLPISKENSEEFLTLISSVFPINPKEEIVFPKLK